METKKAIKNILILVVVVVAIFFLILFLNGHIESKEGARINYENEVNLDEDLLITGGQQSYSAIKQPVINEDDFVSGQGGALDLIVYEDYTDVFSANFNTSLELAKQNFPNRLRIIYRPFSTANTEASWQAAVALSCAVDSNQGEAFRQKMLAVVVASKFGQEDLITWAEELGLNKEDFQNCLTNSKKKGRIETMMSQAKDFSVYGAPTVFVGDEMLIGARPYETFTDSNGDEIEGLKQVIERQLK